MSHALTKQQSLEQVKRLLLMHPNGIRIGEIQRQLDADWATVWRYVTQDLKARKLERGVYTLDPSPEDIELAAIVLQRAGVAVPTTADTEPS